MFIGEIIIGSLIPLLILLTPLRKGKKGQILAALCGVIGILWNRFNFIFTGMARHAGKSYFPSFVEWGIVIGLMALMVVIYIFLVENLPVHRNKDDEKPEIVIR